MISFLKKRKDAIVIFHPYTDIFSNSTMMLLMEKYVENGENIYLYTYEKPTGLGKLENKIHFEKLPRIFPRLARRPDIIFRYTLYPILVCLLKSIFSYKIKKYLAVDQEGLLIFNKIFPSKLKYCNYISFEIFIGNEITNERQAELKKQEIELLKRGVYSLLIQGKYRHKLFIDEHKGANIQKTFYLPVAPAKFTEIKKTNSIVPIPEGKKSIVYSGSLHLWAGIIEILEQVKNNWNPEFHLVIHYRFPEHDNPVIKTIEDLVKDGYPITFYIKKFVSTEYYSFLKQFDAAFATYISNPKSNYGIDGQNFEVIGLSSGKFNAQMMLGIPTITTNNHTFVDLFKKYKFGYVLFDFSDIKKALEEVGKNTEEMSKEAKRLYHEIIDPELYIDEYINLEIV